MMSSRLPEVTSPAPGSPLETFFARVLEHRETPLNLHRALAHAPLAAMPFVSLAYALRYDVALDRRLQELAILRVASLVASTYEWAAHEPLARSLGVNDAQLGALRANALDRASFTDAERVVLLYVERVVRGERVDDGLFERLRGALGSREVVELTLTIGLYVATAAVIAALEVRPEDHESGQPSSRSTGSP